MALDNGLYPQVVMVRRRELDDKKVTYKTKIYNFQGQSARTKHWINLDHEWLKENFMTRELDFYLKLYQTKFRSDKIQNYQKFGLPIGNAKITKKYSSAHFTGGPVKCRFHWWSRSEDVV